MTIEDQSEIRSLLCRERWARDTCQWEKLRDSYHPDSSKTRVNISWYDGDIDDFVAHSKRLASKDVSIMHLINPSDIEVRGTKALAESAGLIMSRFEHQGYEYDFTIWCRFVNQTEKVEGTWKLLTLEMIYMRDVIVPVPGSPALDFSGVKDWPRRSYRFTAWHLMGRGLKVREDLPGLDDDRSVTELMDRNYAWINA